MSDISNVKHKQDGCWIQGAVKAADFRINEDAITAKMKELKAIEANKIPLWQASREQLDQYFTKVFRLKAKPLLNQFPSFTNKILDVLFEHRRAFTASESDSQFKQEAGHCTFYTYDPELEEGWKHNTWTAPVSKLSPEDEAQLLEILLRWESQGIICRQDVRTSSSSGSPEVLCTAPLLSLCGLTYLLF